MKKNLVLFILMLSFFFLFLTPGLPGKPRNRGVYLYTMPNFLGSECHLLADISQLSQYIYKNKNFDNKIASIRLVGFSSIAVYSDPHFRGTCMTITGDIRNLARTKIKANTISSVKLNSQCVSNVMGVTLYNEKNFKGKSVTITENTPDLGILNFKNKAASFELNGLRSIAVFSKTRYQGKCQTFTINYRSLAGTDIGINKIASIKINDKCDEHKKLTIRNRSGLVIVISVPSGNMSSWLTDLFTEPSRTVASGQQRVFFIKSEATAHFNIIAMVPEFPNLLKVHPKLLCSQNIFMARDHVVTVKGAVFKKMRCEKSVGN